MSEIDDIYTDLSNPRTMKHEHYFRQIKLLRTRFSERLIIQLLQDISINFFLINFTDQI